jgi:hypothetical protein
MSIRSKSPLLLSLLLFLVLTPGCHAEETPPPKGPASTSGVMRRPSAAPSAARESLAPSEAAVREAEAPSSATPVATTAAKITAKMMAKTGKTDIKAHVFSAPDLAPTPRKARFSNPAVIGRSPAAASGLPVRIASLGGVPRTAASSKPVETAFPLVASASPIPTATGGGASVSASGEEPALDPQERAEGQEDVPEDFRRQLEELQQQVKKLREEAVARKRLAISTEEKEEKAADILSAASRKYILLKKGTLGFEYSFNYAYFSGDVIQKAAIVEQHSNHTFTNVFFTEYALRDNLTVNATLPFVYKYNRVGTSNAQEATDFGDFSLGVQYQPFKTGGHMPAAIFNAGVTLPLGTSPYKVVPDQGLGTGSGFYSVNAGVSLSRTMDPLVAFGSLSYTHNFPAGGLDQNWQDGRTLIGVDPGSSVGLGLGFGFALSYKASLNVSAQFGYTLSNEYHFSNAETYRNGSTVSTTFYIGTGWRVTPTRSVYLKLGIGLTSNDPDFSFSVRVPFEF